jgi:hypothetical protein
MRRGLQRTLVIGQGFVMKEAQKGSLSVWKE